jgi:prolyl oligopeptidase
LKDRLERVRFTNIAWVADNSGFFYSRYPEDEEHHQKLYFHRLGEDQGKDRLVYERPEDPNLGSSGSVSHDGRWLAVHVWQGTASENEMFVQRLDAPGELQPLFTGFEHNFDFIDAVEDRLYFATDKEAPRRRIVYVDMNASPRQLVEVVPQHPTDVISEAQIVGGRLVVASMHNAHDVLRVHELSGELLHDVDMPTLGSLSGISGVPEASDCFVGYTSFLFPNQNYRLDVDAGSLALYQEAEIQFDPEPFMARQIFYESKDGTKVPLFLVHRRGLVLDGNNPVMLYGYGGFNISRTPFFSTSVLLWLEQGGVFAMPNLRGGGEFGEEWHRAGMLGKKQNVFDDFIAAAEWLIDNGYTRPGRLVIDGASNGGLLTAACALQRPDLYGAVLVRVPVIDMLRYHLFTIGSYWMPEYGDPQNPEHFEFMYAYSPLHNVREGESYPAMLITTADTDTRVHPAHAKKFAATLQARNVSDEPILLRVETKAGHGAGKPITKSIEEKGDLYSFVMDQLGMSFRRAGAAMSTRSSR